jgi:histone arginine demethylase JMJD6
MTKIPRIGAPRSEEFFNDFVLPRRPVIIRDFAPWKAFDSWSIENFRKRFGDRTVKLPSGQKRMDAFLDEVLASTPGSPGEYLNQVPIAKEFPELLDDILPIPSAMKPNWLTNSLMLRRWGTFDGFCELFIGGAGAGFTRLHCDMYWVNTMITQVVGAKEFTLFAPSDTPYLYPNPTTPYFSSIPRIDDVSDESFPLFAKAEPIVVRVEPGETIYVPWGFWHATRILEPSIAVAASTANRGNWREFSQDFSKYGKFPHRVLKQAVTKLVSAVESRKPIGGN